MGGLSKVVSIECAASLLADGCTVALSGSSTANRPMAFVREVVRQRRQNLRIIGWRAGIDFDMLVRAGCCTRCETSRGDEAGCVRAQQPSRWKSPASVAVEEYDESVVIDRFRAGGSGATCCLAPVAQVPHPEVTPRVQCPFTGQEYAVLEAWRPDFAVIHAAAADKDGNTILGRHTMSEAEVDQIIARSAEKVVVTVEQVVSSEYIAISKRLDILSGTLVEAVVEVPFGAHPYACDSVYRLDCYHLDTYYESACTSEGFLRYLEQYVCGCEDHFQYLKRIGLGKLLSIRCFKEVP